MPTSLQGQLLVASPELRDSNFLHTVVLMVQHGEQGALGLVLNRPTKATLKEVWSQVSELPCERNDLLHVGGPVQGPLMAVHTVESASEQEVFSGVYFCSGREHLQQLVLTDGPVKFCAGFAGWSAGQLEGELAEGAWRTTAATAQHVFDVAEDLWEQVSKEIVGSEVLGLLKIKHVPPDPSLN